MILEAKKTSWQKKEPPKGKGLKILTPQHTLQRLPISLAQVKAGNTSENVNKIRQILYSLYRAKDITKKVYNNIVIQKWTQYVWVLKIVKHLILTDYHSILRTK